MKQKYKDKAMNYINKQRQENNIDEIDEIGIADLLKEQFLNDQYIAACIDERKKQAEFELLDE